MELILIVKTVAGTLVTLPPSAPTPPRGLEICPIFPYYPVRYAPRVYSVQYSVQLLRTIITDEKINENP